MAETPRPPLRYSLVALPVAVAHFVATFATLSIHFAQAAARRGTDAPAGALERTADLLFRVLAFPMRSIVAEAGGLIASPFGWLPFFLNSLLWGTAVWMLVRRVRERRRKPG